MDKNKDLVYLGKKVCCSLPAFYDDPCKDCPNNDQLEDKDETSNKDEEVVK